MNDHAEQFELDDELKALDAQLRQQLPVAAPAGLADRVFEATVGRLPGGAEAPAVIARIGPWGRAWRFAAAAVVLIAAGVGTWLMWSGGGIGQDEAPWLPQIAVVSSPDEPIDTDIEMLALDVEQLALAMHNYHGSAIDDSRLEEDLWFMEAGFDTF